jgi:threonine/homoserine/homoserine lactone efflux protein
METPLLVRGLILGFSIAAPVGPIGILCIRRSASSGMTAGLATGLGAAVADSVYGAVVAFGFTSISGLIARETRWIAFCGGLLLLYIGVGALRERPGESGESPHTLSNLAAFATTVVLTLANPATIVSFAAAYAGFALRGTSTGSGAAAFVAGVFAGSALWWLILSSATAWLGKGASAAALARINRVSGLVIVAFGLAAATFAWL